MDLTHLANLVHELDSYQQDVAMFKQDLETARRLVRERQRDIREYLLTHDQRGQFSRIDWKHLREMVKAVVTE